VKVAELLAAKGDLSAEKSGKYHARQPAEAPPQIHEKSATLAKS
jgi:hypothetical protein